MDKRDKEIENLRHEIDFWKTQFFKLVEIITQTKKVTDDTMKHINKIFGY